MPFIINTLKIQVIYTIYEVRNLFLFTIEQINSADYMIEIRQLLPSNILKNKFIQVKQLRITIIKILCFFYCL
jgi:hypothetical protein